MILVHGLGANAHFWRNWVPRLSERHRTLALDLAGFGRAPIRSGADYSPPAQAARIAALARRLRGPPPVLIGHSLGAGTALLAALKLRDESPDLAPPGLVIVSGAVYAQKLPPFLTLARIPVVGDLMLCLPPPRGIFRRAVEGIVADPGRVDVEMTEGYRKPLTTFRRRRAILRAARQIDLEAARLLVDRLDELEMPALLVWGEADRIVPLELGERLARDLPMAELVTLQGVGHLPPEEAPVSSLEPVLSFLRSLSGPARGGVPGPA